MTDNDWTTPLPVTDVDLAFPANALDYMPPMAEIPDELDPKWERFQGDWFARGLPENTEIDLKAGIDGNEAMRHLRVIQGSFAPKHEHKVAAVAYLASLWFDDVRYSYPAKASR